MFCGIVSSLRAEQRDLAKRAYQGAYLFGVGAVGVAITSFGFRGDCSIAVAPDDFATIPLHQLYFADAREIQSGFPRELWGAARAYQQRSNPIITTRPPSGSRPILDAFSLVAEHKGESAEGSGFGKYHVRAAQDLSLDISGVTLGGRRRG